MKSRGLLARSMLVLGLVFLYVPIVSMMVFSFNNSRLVTVWDAVHSPTLKWYHALLHNEQILGAAFLSIRIALISASAAVVLGTLAGMALARFGPFRGRLLLAGMTTAPIVMPEVITGLSLLLLFVAMGQLIGWPRGAGAITITLAHVTFCMAYVTVVVQSRLTGFDESLEEAAMDLGARLPQVVWHVILPQVRLPLLAAGAFAFIISFDQLETTLFLVRPGMMTLPVRMFLYMETFQDPTMAALSTILILGAAAGLLLFGLVLHRREAEAARVLRAGFPAAGPTVGAPEQP